MERLSAGGRRIETAGQRALLRFGLEVRRRRTHPWRPPGTRVSARTIIDVGAADGTPDLYRAFPEAGLVVAFDPIPEQLAKVQRSVGTRNVELHDFALGSSPGSLELQLPDRDIFKSSFHPRTNLTAERGKSATRSVRIQRLDDVARECNWPSPFVLKIDTEGHDLEVLLGATETLAHCAVVYCETSLGSRFEGGYRFSELHQLLYERGFEIVDVLEAPRGPDARVLFLNCVWVPRSLPA
jgi:FkbM family methyltransferase